MGDPVSPPENIHIILQEHNPEQYSDEANGKYPWNSLGRVKRRG